MITIIGAGLSGLIAANILTRRHRLAVRIIEAQQSLPNNHAALLRFRSDAVAVATGIPFRKVLVTKGIYYRGQFVAPNLKLNNLYSYKVTGRYANRSILDISPGERWIAPPNLIERLAEGINIYYGQTVVIAGSEETGPTISTIPMPALMGMVSWKSKPDFPVRAIWSYRVKLSDPVPDIYQTIYFPDPKIPGYRMSITGDELISETMINPKIDEISNYSDYISTLSEVMGLESKGAPAIIKHQPYGKIMPTDEEERRAFILAMTDKHEIYSLGRFACWRQLLLDDIVQDVDRIAMWIKERSRYNRKLEL